MQIAVLVILVGVVVTSSVAFSTMRRTSVSPSAVKSFTMTAQPTDSLTAPGRTFLNCVSQAAKSTRKAIDDGFKLLEVEFPPLPLEYLEDSSSSARDIADANTRWAIEFAKSFTDLGQISLIYPDQPELDDAIRYLGGGDAKLEGGENPLPNIRLATIRSDSIKNAKSLDQILLSVFGATVAGTVDAIPNTAVYIAMVSSTQELPDLEKLHLLDPSVPIIFFNLRLDILRGDLGLPLFPGRDLHHRFLCKIKSSYLMRSRSYSTNLSRPPFIVNYSGLLFRAYPELYQCILNVGNGKTKLAKTLEGRPTNADFRDALTDSMVIPNVPKEEFKTKQSLVWWEKDLAKDQSPIWMT